MSRGQVLADVWRVYADLARPPVDVTDVARWRDRVRHDAAQRHVAQANRLLDDMPGLTAEAVARALLWDTPPGDVAALFEAEQITRAAVTSMTRNTAALREMLAGPKWDGSHVDGIAAARDALGGEAP